MDRSLCLLLWLRSRARVRIALRGFRSLKGLVLALVGMLALVPLLLSTFINPRIQVAAQTAMIRHYGPLVLLAYCLLNVVMSSGDRSVEYSPAEINILFSAPYRPRQLLLYKMLGNAGSALVSALFMTFLFAHHASSFLAAGIGLFLSLELFALFALAVGLIVSTAGALAFSRIRRVVLALLIGLALAAVFPLGKAALEMDPSALLDYALRSSVVSALTLPFRPFAMAFTAPRIWPDLLSWSSLAALVDLALVGLIVGLNARFLEATATAGARRYEQASRSRRGRLTPLSSHHRSIVPDLPWFAGVGPNAWRQLTTASRSSMRIVTTILLFVVPVVVVLLAGGRAPGDATRAVPALSVFLSIVAFGPSVVAFDFRGDLRRMEDLKTLPIRPTALVVSQLLTPTLVLGLAQSLAILTIATTTSLPPSLAVAAWAICLPVNVVILAVENFYFLIYPFRSVGLNSFDFQVVGRQILLTMARLLTLAIIGGLAFALAYLGYLMSGDSLRVGLAIAWLVSALCGSALIPLVAIAFERHDVAGTPPE